MRRRGLIALGLLACLLGMSGCDQPEMANQPKYETYEAVAREWPDHQSARVPPANTVARDTDLDARSDHFPLDLTQELLDRGQQRYEVQCVPCHGRVGYADGMVVQRGFPAPPSFHTDRLRDAPLSHIYDVITHGYGVMYSYADRVKPVDRWAIAAYIRALQVSQHMPANALDTKQRAALDAAEAGGGAP